MSNESNVIRGYYAVIPSDVRYDPTLTPNAKLLYGEITALCNEAGECQITNSYFADLYKVTTTSISQWISTLRAAGYIETEIDYKGNVRTILLQHSSRAEKQGDIAFMRMKENLHTSERKLNSLKTNTNNTKEKTNKKDEEPNSLLGNLKPKVDSKAKAEQMVTMNSMISAYSQDPQIREALKDYLYQRRGKGLTPAQWKIILDDLKKFVGDDTNLTIEKIRGAFAGGYMQIIASWEKPRQNASKRVTKQFDNTAGSKTSIKQEVSENLSVGADGKPLEF